MVKPIFHIYPTSNAFIKSKNVTLLIFQIHTWFDHPVWVYPERQWGLQLYGDQLKGWPPWCRYNFIVEQLCFLICLCESNRMSVYLYRSSGSLRQFSRPTRLGAKLIVWSKMLFYFIPIINSGCVTSIFRVLYFNGQWREENSLEPSIELNLKIRLVYNHLGPM